MIDEPVQNDEREALKALIESEGWTLFLAHVDAEWGPVAYAAKIDRAIAAAKANRDSAEGDIVEIGASARAVQLAAKWPKNRMDALRAEKPSRGAFPPWRRAQ